MIKILIADDYDLIREGLKKIIKQDSSIEVVAEAKNGAEVLPLLQKHEIDVIVLDISMPVRDGIDVLKDITKYYPSIPTLMLTMHSEKKYAMRALMAGAAGYINKESTSKELILAIKKVVVGGKYITPIVAEYLVETIQGGSNKVELLHELLTDKEFQILCRLASGFTIKKVSEDLNITISTVHTYKGRIFKKMGFNTIPDLMRYCLQHKLLEE
jgi:two-component system, NarL family, invasion response regulator UvrY